MSVLDDLVTRLEAQSVGTGGTDIFTGSGAAIPLGMGPYLSLTEYGGLAPTRVQNKSSAASARPMVQVLVRAGRISGVQEAYPAARAMAWAAYQALDGVIGVVLNGVIYISIRARQEPADMGMDATGNRVQVVFNVEIEKQPSA